MRSAAASLFVSRGCEEVDGPRESEEGACVQEYVSQDPGEDFGLGGSAWQVVQLADEAVGVQTDHAECGAEQNADGRERQAADGPGGEVGEPAGSSCHADTEAC